MVKRIRIEIPGTVVLIGLRRRIRSAGAHRCLPVRYGATACAGRHRNRLGEGIWRDGAADEQQDDQEGVCTHWHVGGGS